MSEQVAGRSGRLYTFHPDGTPKSLREAVKQGIENGAVAYRTSQAGIPVPSLAEIIESSVRDYLSQKFSVSMIECDENPEVLKEVEALWKRIKG